MKPRGTHNYLVYILTNKTKNVLYVGVTNNLKRRLTEHKSYTEGPTKHFTGRYNCIYAIYYENFQWIQDAIAREKEIKGWLRIKKEKLINEFNPEWKFLNDEIED